MRIKNSKDFALAPFEITVQDLAIIFDQLDIGFRKQIQIIDDIWDNEKWILPEKYQQEGKKKKFLEDVRYQVDYLYNKSEIDGSLGIVRKNAEELGYYVDTDSLTENYAGISEYFKTVWIQLKYISNTGYTRSKIRTIMDKYHYKRRSNKFIDYFKQCICFYGITPQVGGSPCDIRNVPIDTMITFRLGDCNVG